MRDLIFDVLSNFPNLTGREIAKKLGVERREVNSFLDKNRGEFHQDENYRWSNFQNKELVIEFPEKWVNADTFEASLKIYPNLFELDNTIRIVFNERLLLDAIIRLLCLTNQLCQKGKLVCLDFRNCMNTFGYLNRLNFFKYLHNSAQVLPERPNTKLAEKYKNNSENLIEVFPICSEDMDNEEVLRISKVLKNSFNEYETQVLLPKLQMFIGSLIDNVREHGYSSLTGYSALQIYNIPNSNQKKIVLVIADNGCGLINTLRKALTYEHYKNIALPFQGSDIESNKRLIAYVLNNGGITQTGIENRGLGLNEAHSALAKISKKETIDLLKLQNIDVNVSIRLDDCKYHFPYHSNYLKDIDLTHTGSLTKMYGTQFILTIVLTK